MECSRKTNESTFAAIGTEKQQKGKECEATENTAGAKRGSGGREDVRLLCERRSCHTFKEINARHAWMG